MIKVLFVLPSGDTIYGSGRSVVQLARALGVKYDILVGRSLIQTINEEMLRKDFGCNLENIYSLWLPNSNFYYGKSNNIFIRLAAIHKYLMWVINKGRFKNIIQNNDYAVIHLNSLILAPMIRSEYRMILHVREVFEGLGWQHKYIEKRLQWTKGVIYINPSTKAAFDNQKLNATIIQDPFEMTHLADMNANDIKKGLGLKPGDVVFSILGRYEDRNGTEFIINTFHKVKNKRAVLLVVGRGHSKEIERIKCTVGSDSRIKLLGEWSDPSPIYAISDYIIRGERFFSGFSRTVYEGLYSGCKVIFPGRREEAVDSLQYDEFKESLVFYSPRDENELIYIIEQCIENPVTERSYKSNREEYVEAYLRLVNSICE